jgi:ERCC4-type nuclease
VLIAPTEPPPIKALGSVSSRPEKHGADALFMAKGQWCGVQRKAMSDLIASVHDGRIQREVAQMQSLHRRLLIVEGRLQWTMDGILMGSGFGRDWTYQIHEGMMWSMQDMGVWVWFTDDVAGTARSIVDFEKWCKKAKHTALIRRPGPAPDAWGTVGSRAFGMHLLMGVDGIGPELAGAIWDHFGEVPMRWSVGVKDLMGVKGIGKIKAEKLISSLEKA